MSGYFDEIYNNIRCYSCLVTTGTPITLAASTVVPDIDFALSKPQDAVLSDSLDSGAVGGWSSQSAHGGDLAVTMPGLNGTPYGVKTTITPFDDRTPLYLQDDTPADDTWYRFRFMFDPKNFDPGVAQAHFRARIFLAFGVVPGPPAQNRRLIAVVLQRQANGLYRVQVRALQDDNSRADTGFFPITAAPHTIEVAWQRATSPDMSDGTLHLWLDGVLVRTLTGLSNNRAGIEFVRLGLTSLKGGVDGMACFDEFVSRRHTYIGVP
jgi:hypothetical protein